MKVIPLIVIDMQQAFFDPKWGKRNNPDAEDNIIALIHHWRATNKPIIFVQHESEHKESLFHPKASTHQFMDNLKPLDQETIVTKKVNSAFIGTNLESILNGMNSTNIVIVGLTTNHCVETTTRMAGNLGYHPILVSDACATFERMGLDGSVYPPELLHEITMTNLNKEFAIIMNTKQALKL